MICNWLPVLGLSLISAHLIEIFSGYSFVRWCQESVHYLGLVGILAQIANSSIDCTPSRRWPSSRIQVG